MGEKMTIPKALCLILLAIAFANGAFRAYYERYLGAHRANQVSCGIGIALFAIAVWIVNRRWPFESSAQAWRTGVLWMLMTVTWEFLFFHYVAGRSWKELAGNYAFCQGQLWVLVLLAVLVLPPLAVGSRRSRAAVSPCLLWGVIAWAACGLVFGMARLFWDGNCDVAALGRGSRDCIRRDFRLLESSPPSASRVRRGLADRNHLLPGFSDCRAIHRAKLRDVREHSGHLGADGAHRVHLTGNWAASLHAGRAQALPEMDA
jgi:hypothetical protein